MLTLLIDLSARFFAANGYKPQSMDELLLDEGIELSDAEREWAEAYVALWDASEALTQTHPATYG